MLMAEGMGKQTPLPGQLTARKQVRQPLHGIQQLAEAEQASVMTEAGSLPQNKR